jgi:hypothetical protein
VRVVPLRHLLHHVNLVHEIPPLLRLGLRFEVLDGNCGVDGGLEGAGGLDGPPDKPLVDLPEAALPEGGLPDETARGDLPLVLVRQEGSQLVGVGAVSVEAREQRVALACWE